MGRGALSAAQTYSHPTVPEPQEGLQQIQPLPLVSPKTHLQQNGLNAQEVMRSNGIKDSHFFRTFLTNSLEAFGERVVEAEEEAAEKEASSNGNHFVKGEQIEEKPLQLTKTTKTEQATQKTEEIKPKTEKATQKKEIPEKTEEIPEKTEVIPEKTEEIPEKTEEIPEKTEETTMKTEETTVKTKETSPKSEKTTEKSEKATEKTEKTTQNIEKILQKIEPPPHKIEPTPPPQMEEKELKPSPCPSPASTPPPTASPTKRLSNGVSRSKKSSRSTKGGSPPVTPLLSRGSGSSASSSPALTPAGRPRKTKEQLDVLKQHFLCCQWPKSEDYTELVKLTGLPRADVIQWFGDTRYAVKNGQLRWVQGVREQFLAELATQAMQQGNGGVTNGNSTTPRGGGGSRKRKSGQANGTAANTDTLNIQPLEAYHQSTGKLQEKDLDSLCKRSRMSYQQVREWFASQVSDVTELESDTTD